MQTRKDVFNFRGALKPPAVASRQGIWCSKATGSCTIATGSDGSMQLVLDSTSEVQNGCLYFGDVLAYDIDDLIRVEFLTALSASFAAANMAAFGMASARHDTLDSVAAHTWFRIEGNNNVLAETDDGTNDNDDKATAQTLGTSFKRFAIDFATGHQTIGPPGRSKGGKAAVQFFAGDANGLLRRVAESTNFDVSNYTAGLQPFAQIQKSTGTTTGTLSILEVSVEYRLPSTVR